jgi:hypothetical protein
VSTEVELDVYSGMPNPTWTLSAADAALLAEKLDALPPAAPRELGNPLGYRGLVVDTGAEVVRVHRGTAQVSRAGSIVVRADPGRSFERWLISTGVGTGVLTGELVDVVDADLRH